MIDSARKLQQIGADFLIMACTELPLSFKAMRISEGTIDPTMVLARAAVQEAGGELKY